MQSSINSKCCLNSVQSCHKPHSLRFFSYASRSLVIHDQQSVICCFTHASPQYTTLANSGSIQFCRDCHASNWTNKKNNVKIQRTIAGLRRQSQIVRLDQKYVPSMTDEAEISWEMLDNSNAFVEGKSSADQEASKSLSNNQGNLWRRFSTCILSLIYDMLRLRRFIAIFGEHLWQRIFLTVRMWFFWRHKQGFSSRI